MPLIRKPVRIWAIAYAIAGVTACVVNLSLAGSSDLRRFFLYLVCANIATLGLRLTANRSLVPAGLLVLLLGVEELSLPELLFIAFTVALLRDLSAVRRVSQVPALLYSIASVTIGIATAQTVYRITASFGYSSLFPAPVIASSFVLLFNCGFATTLLRDPTRPFIGVYHRECRPLLPWFVAAAYLAYLIRCTSLQTKWHPGLIALPILFALDRGYRAWSEAKAKHKIELAELHRRTLETLAVAIDARDHTTQMHLRRVQVYAGAVGTELGLNEAELESLNVAALLHDIGKLGIPDHILLKPGSLTVEEWEKMKTHPMIGAELLSRMRFPESVLSVVKAHHEKWDGTGYPLGLAGEQIPIGARILSAVDCLDALASDRPYRSALPLVDAMAKVQADKGTSFDPIVVAVLERRYTALERMAWEAAGDGLVKTTEGPSESPQADLGRLAVTLLDESKAAPNSILAPIVSARQETQLLQALSNDLAHSFRVEDVASSVHKCLSRMIRYDTLAVYLRRGEDLEPIQVIGGHSALFSWRAFPIANGPSGGAAQHRISILNGDPASECCYSRDSIIVNSLKAALAVPFEGGSETTGVLTLYHTERDAFSRDDLRIVQAASLHVGRAIDSALRYQVAEESAVTDHLTGIPNARSLAIHLERELARASRENSMIGVLVCDLDGFKQVNDRFGHLKGNEVLQLVANGLKEACRSSDYLARMGGDEFVIVMPGFRYDLCSSYVDRLRAVALNASRRVCRDQSLSMSVGAAVYPSHGHDAESLLAEADRRMYRAKEQHKGGDEVAGAPHLLLNAAAR